MTEAQFQIGLKSVGGGYLVPQWCTPMLALAGGVAKLELRAKRDLFLCGVRFGHEVESNASLTLQVYQAGVGLFTEPTTLALLPHLGSIEHETRALRAGDSVVIELHNASRANVEARPYIVARQAENHGLPFEVLR